MRKFHRLLHYDPEGTLAQVIDYRVGDFDVTTLWHGEQLTSGPPPDLRLIVSLGDAPDYMANPLSWPIFSERFVDILAGRAESDLQLFDAPLFDAQTGQAVPGYKIVNVMRSIACLDLERSGVLFDEHAPNKLVSVYRIALLGTKVPPDVHVFRIQEWPYEVMFSDEAATDCVGKRLRGVAFEECATTDL